MVLEVLCGVHTEELENNKMILHEEFKIHYKSRWPNRELQSALGYQRLSLASWKSNQCQLWRVPAHSKLSRYHKTVVEVCNTWCTKNDARTFSGKLKHGTCHFCTS